MNNSVTIDTAIHIGNVAIHEPVAVFTSYIISGMCFYYYWKLKKTEAQHAAISPWAKHLLFVGFASLVGSFSHGFFAVHQGFGYEMFWLPMQVLNITAVYFAQQAVLNSVLTHSPFNKYWKLSYNIQLAIFLTSVFIFHNFLVVIINAVVGIIPLIVLLFKNSKKENSSLWIATSFFILASSAIIFITKFTLHKYFNHIDLSHVIMMLCLWMIYKGAKKLSTSS